MSRYTSEQTAYSPLKKEYVPLRRLDTNTVTVTHFNTDTQTEESKTYGGVKKLLKTQYLSKIAAQKQRFYVVLLCGYFYYNEFFTAPPSFL